jgi:DNA-binding transcriptional LysR family regulator
MFSLEQLQSFVAVAEELHFGRAAARLSMTQPPLSRKIKQLEDELGVLLFDRAHRTIKLTPAGRVFLADARRLLHLSHEAALSARRTPRGESGVVTLGFTATTAYSFLEHVVAAASVELPNVELGLREMVTSAQVEELLEGGIDVGLIRPPVAGADLVTTLLYREPLLAALPESHPLATRKAVPSVRDLDGQPFIMYSPSEARYFHEVLVSIFRSAEVAPNYVQYLSQVHSMLALVKAGLGIALVPAAATALHYRGLVLRPVTGIDANPVKLGLAWRRSNDNPALAALLPVIEKIAGRHGETGSAQPG